MCRWWRTPCCRPGTPAALLREHRLYQADWLLRFYGFRAEELLDASHPDFNPQVDPKCSWALQHLDFFPVEVNRADYETLLRIPGVGVVSAKRILVSRRARKLRIEDLPKLGVVMKRAQYFLTASGRMADGLRFTPDSLLRNLIAAERSPCPSRSWSSCPCSPRYEGGLSMTEMIYEYDGSFEGLLSCVFESYTQKKSSPRSPAVRTFNPLCSPCGRC